MPTFKKSTGFKSFGSSIYMASAAPARATNFVKALFAAQTKTKDIKPTVMKLGRETRTSPMFRTPEKVPSR